MAAVIAPTTAPTRRRAPAPRPDLRVIPGGRDAARRHRRPRRVYRRRRLVAATVAVVAALTIALAVVGAASLLEGTAAPATGSPPVAWSPVGAPAADPANGPAVAGVGSPGPVPVAYVVQPGDTVWEIARRLQPEGDVRPLVDRIADRTDGGALMVGQRIALDDLVG